jgi:cytidylate kinase
MAILTISREYGSGGKEIGRTVAERTGYRYIDRQQVLEEMRKVGAQWEEKTKYFDENSPEVWERNDWFYRGFVALNQSHILDNAVRDDVVIMGRGGGFLLKGIPFVLSIRTTAPLERRIENVMRWEGINGENARYLIEKADKEMAGSVYVIYGRHWDDPEQYDMTFDTAVQGYEGIISTIAGELAKRELLNTEDKKEILSLRALAARIKAKIAVDPTLSVSTMDVRPKEEGLVEYGLFFGGVVHNRDDIKRIEDVSREMAGDVKIEFDLHYRMYSRLG